VPLHIEVRGSGPPLVLLHGFTQTARLWGPFGELVATSRTVLAVDLPGHGGSAALRADLPTTADLVASSVRDLLGEGTSCDVLGYSLGARVALHVATGTDLIIGRLALIGGTGGIADAERRARRRASDDALADDLESSGDVEAFVRSWLRRPMFERLTSLGTSDLAERLRNTAEGLASSLRLCGAGTQEPLWDRLPLLACPLLAVAGADDARFAADAVAMSRIVPDGVVSLVPGGGHAAHLAQPSPVARLVRHWFDVAPSAATPLTAAPRS
jgi:2-succinyl-6-hydroxy-2,4-cyclohexadiene-1-carboxylate synthase